MGGGLLDLGVPFWGLPVQRIIVSCGLYWGSYLGRLPYASEFVQFWYAAGGASRPMKPKP